MKFLFVVIYVVIETFAAPCPDANYSFGCAVYHGTVTDTTQIEVMTMDSSRVQKILKEHPDAKVDTFLISPFIKH